MFRYFAIAGFFLALVKPTFYLTLALLVVNIFNITDLTFTQCIAPVGLSVSLAAVFYMIGSLKFKD